MWVAKLSKSGHARRMVFALTRNRAAISPMGRSVSSRIRRASARWLGERAGGRPPTLPRLRAASRPSRVRSAIRPRSNSAIEAKTWNTNRPAGVGMVHQHFTLAENLTGLDNVVLGTEPLWRWRRHRTSARERLRALGDLFD